MTRILRCLNSFIFNGFSKKLLPIITKLYNSLAKYRYKLFYSLKLKLKEQFYYWNSFIEYLGFGKVCVIVFITSYHIIMFIILYIIILAGPLHYAAR